MKLPAFTIPIWLRWKLRVVKQAPLRAYRDWKGAFLNEGQLLSLALAAFTSWVGLQTATVPEVIEEANSWVNALQALVYVSLGWAVICLVRAPFAVGADEKKLGQVYGNRFVYHEPLLIASVLCKATGQASFHKIVFDHAEPRSFVHYMIEVDGSFPNHLFTAVVSGGVVMSSDLEPGHGVRQGGTRIGADKSAHLIVSMRGDAVSKAFRVYCTDFCLGNPESGSGTEGLNRTEVREIAERNGRRRGP